MHLWSPPRVVLSCPSGPAGRGLRDRNTGWRESGPDENGVVTSAHATAIDRTETLLRADGDRLEVVGIGLSNISRGDERCHAGRRPEPRPGPAAGRGVRKEHRPGVSALQAPPLVRPMSQWWAGRLSNAVIILASSRSFPAPASQTRFPRWPRPGGTPTPDGARSGQSWGLHMEPSTPIPFQLLQSLLEPLETGPPRATTMLVVEAPARLSRFSLPPLPRQRARARQRPPSEGPPTPCFQVGGQHHLRSRGGFAACTDRTMQIVGARGVGQSSQRGPFC